MTALTATDHAELDAFWARNPRPMTPIDPANMPGTRTITIVCRVCAARVQVAAFVEHLLCASCASDLDTAEATVQGRLEALKAEEAQVMEVWVEAQAALDDVTASRWVTLCADRDRVTAQLQRSRTEKYYGWDNDQIAANIAAKQAAYDEVMTKIARTAQKPGPLAQLLKGYALWKQALISIADRRAQADAALMEIDAARPGGAPF